MGVRRVVIETPDGRVLLYDTGTTAGPDAMRRVVAPYLWSRGISRIDEVFLSHAGLKDILFFNCNSARNSRKTATYGPSKRPRSSVE